MSGEKKVRILFLCTGNSCRSQMAEGWARHLKGDSIEAFSAGTDPQPLDVRAVKVMAEAGVDISAQQPKSIEEFTGEQFDYVVSVCDAARAACPVFPGAGRKVHAGFDDPPALAHDAADQEEALSHYRRVRDEIRRFVELLPEALEGAE